MMTTEFASASAGLADLSSVWGRNRRERQARRHLDPIDFDAVRQTGFLELVVPRDAGGCWDGLSTSARPMAEILRVMAQGDPSVALVASMHPSVVSFWLLNDHPDDGWQQQRQAVFATAMSGQQWGTITSEPGSGGDIAKTRSAARRDSDLNTWVPGDTYRITGDKHFGSGSGVTSFMITTALPSEDEGPAIFVLDVRDRPWEREAGMSLTAEWDGMGMAATQSHAMRLVDMPATRLSWNGPLAEITQQAAPFNALMFTAVVLGVLDEAVRTARAQIIERDGTLRAFEQTEWTRADSEHWLAEQAFQGALRALETGNTATASHAASRAKQAVAELAEKAMLRLSRVLGGGTFSQRSPFSHWFEDVRALGFLRPPWGLAFDGLYASSLKPD
jgi:alkylation response protein AidB-like acyl-CoA dehydrogenase